MQIDKDQPATGIEHIEKCDAASAEIAGTVIDYGIGYWHCVEPLQLSDRRVYVSNAG